jgi:hypothetical protein
MSQTRISSFIESVSNTVIGYVTAIISQLIIFPMFDIHIPFTDNLLIGVMFTFISLARAFIIRRLLGLLSKVIFS